MNGEHVPGPDVLSTLLATITSAVKHRGAGTILVFWDAVRRPRALHCGHAETPRGSSLRFGMRAADPILRSQKSTATTSQEVEDMLEIMPSRLCASYQQH